MVWASETEAPSISVSPLRLIVANECVTLPITFQKENIWPGVGKNTSLELQQVKKGGKDGCASLRVIRNDDE